MLASWLEWPMRALGSRSVARLADRVDGCTLRDSSGAETRRRCRSGLERAGKRCHDLAPPPASGGKRGAHRGMLVLLLRQLCVQRQAWLMNQGQSRAESAHNLDVARRSGSAEALCTHRLQPSLTALFSPAR